MSDFARRSADDYAQGFGHLLPVGRAWPRDEDSVLMRLVRGLSEIWGVRIDASAADLIEIEADPRRTIALLAEWERAYGLPDECVAEPLSVGQRQAALVARMTTMGGQSRAFFVDVARALGYSIFIDEFSPFMAGVSACGDTRETGAASEPFRWEIGDVDMRFFWRVRVVGVALTWFRAGSGQAGVDPHLRIGIASDLECLLRRWKPAHTEIVFAYADAAGALNPLSGTP